MPVGKSPGPTVITNAVSNLQSFMDITPSGSKGQVDKKTLDTVRTPRCGLKDPIRHMAEGDPDVVRHTLFGPRWNKTALVYKIFKFPRKVKKSQYRNAIEEAFRLWSNASPLTFREVNRRDSADIDIRFVSGFHQDEHPFDGPMGVVGHPVIEEMYESRVVRIDVDSDELFSFDSADGINLLQVMVHQIGHALGLGHSSDHDSIMSPCVKPYIPNFTLTETDIAGIQSIYGLPNSPVDPISPPVGRLPSPIIQHSEPRYLCQERPLDAVAILAGEIYVFKGNRYWQFSSPNHLLSPISGSLISERWPGLPTGIDAVYQRNTDNKVVFIRAGRMWIYDIHPKTESDTLAPYTQIHLRDIGLPRAIDMALSCPSWPQSTYFLKKGKVWHYSDQTRSILEGPLEVKDLWNGLPTRRMDAAFTYNDDSYFILGYQYWKVDHTNNRVASGYPMNFHEDFLGC
ncbi:72 kDa type IV collagenase-like [Lytechinus pictus]|uniref:72 kDa type IV collagenase-like n=1 Tax=Lytechinus pictus TaxID=7653 RepID=UPI0030B9DAE9